MDQRRDDRLQQLALAGAARAADEGVGTVFDEVELERPGRPDADRRAEPVRLRFGPLRGDRHRRRQLGPEQREQRDDARDRRGGARGGRVAERRERHGDLVDEPRIGGLRLELLGRRLGIGEPDARQRSAVGWAAVERGLGLARDAGVGADGGDHGHAGSRAQLEELRRDRRVDVRGLVDHDEDPRPSLIGPVVFVGGSRAGHRQQLAHHVGGGRLALDDVPTGQRRRRRPRVRQPLRPRTEALRSALDDDEHEVLRAVQRDRLQHDRRAHRPHVAFGPVEAEDPELLQVHRDRTCHQAVVPGERHRRRLTDVVLTAVLRIDRDLRCNRADTETCSEERLVRTLPRPQVERPERRPPRQVGEVWRLVDPLGPLVEERLLDLGLSLVELLGEPVDRGRVLLDAALAPLDIVRRRHERRHRHHHQHRRLIHEQEHAETHRRRGHHHHQWEPALVRFRRGAADRLELTLRHDDGFRGRATERHLTELVALAVG